MRKNKKLDSGFLLQITEVVINHLDLVHLSGDDLSKHLSLSREHIHRKLKQDISLSTGKFVRNIRLLKAFYFLTRSRAKVAEIGYRVGFDSPSYFSKCFKEAWGYSPGEIMRNDFGAEISKRPIYSFYEIPEIKTILTKNGIELGIKEAPKNINLRKKSWVLGLTGWLAIIIVGTYFIFGKSDQSVLFSQNSRIAILPFINRTTDPNLDHIGDIASSWISNQMPEIKMLTVPYVTVRQYQPFIGILPNDPEGRPTFRELVGADYFVNGSYYLDGQQIVFHSELVDAYSQESLYRMPVISGVIDSVMQVIEEMRLKIAGLVTNLDQVRMGKLTPPNYEAYQHYLKGLQLMTSSIWYTSDAVKYFEKATLLDPNFVMPQIFKTWFYYGARRDSIYDLISEISQITDYEKRIYVESNLLFDRKYHEALRVSLQSLADYPHDYYFNMTAGHRAKSLFMPNLALKVLSQLHDPLNSDVGLVWHHFKIRNYFESLAMLGRYEEALSYLEAIPDDHRGSFILGLFIDAYTKLDKSEKEVEALIQNFGLDENSIPAYYTCAAYEFTLASQPMAANNFARKAITLFRNLNQEASASPFDLIDALFLAGDFSATKKLLEAKLKSNPNNQDWIIYLAQIEAALGNESKANQILEDLPGNLFQWRRNNLEYNREYLLARISALSGQNKKAISFLKKSLAAGELRHYYDFERDLFLKNLFDYPPFLELTIPQG